MITKKENLQAFEHYSARKDYYGKFGFDVEAERDFVLKAVEPLNGNILEIATGKGYFTCALLKSGYEVTTLDVSQEDKEFAKALVAYYGMSEKVKFMICNAENLVFGDGSFENVVSVNTVHHLENPLKVLDEILRVVKPGGKIVLADFTDEGLKIVDRIHESEGRNHPSSEIRLDELEKYLNAKDIPTERKKDEIEDIVIVYPEKK